MLVACWSPKGGSGTTVVSVLLALLWARASAGGAVLADLTGDVPAALGVPDAAGPGLLDWWGAAGGVDAVALGRLEVEVGRSLRLLPCGGSLPGGGGADRADMLAALLGADPRPVVADCGTAGRSPARELAAGAVLSLAVLRPCYLALRRALDADIRPSGVVLVTEPGRALQRRDVEDVLGAPVWAELPLDPAVARAEQAFDQVLGAVA